VGSDFTSVALSPSPSLLKSLISVFKNFLHHLAWPWLPQGLGGASLQHLLLETSAHSYSEAECGVSLASFQAKSLILL
jgi:hypothetical protein